MLLRVTARHFVAGAVWEKSHAGQWRCVRAAPIIRWMVGYGAAYTQERLTRSGCTYEWVKLDE